MEGFQWACCSESLFDGRLNLQLKDQMTENILEKIDPKILGERLKSARRAFGLTQEAVADKLGFVRTTVVAIEKGERRVTADELLAFAKCYARNVSELVKQSAFTEALTPQFRAALPNSQ